MEWYVPLVGSGVHALVGDELTCGLGFGHHGG